MQRFLLVIVLLGLLRPLPVWGAFELQPRLTVREEFTDNVFLDDRDEESDFITTVQPGVMLRYQARLLEVELDYSLHYLKYLHHTDKDETSLNDTQRALFKGLLLPGQDFTVTLLDEYQRVTIDNRRQVDDDSPFVNKSNRNKLVVNPEYRSGYFSTFTPIVGYRFEKLDYQEPEGDDSERHEFYGDLEKKVNPKLTATLGYRHTTYRAVDDDDYQRQDISVRLHYRLSPSLTLRAAAARVWLDYQARSDERALTWDIGLDWQPGPRWKAGLTYREDFDVSVNEGVSRNRRAEAFFAWLQRIPTELRLYAEKQDYRTEDREDRSTGLYLKVSLPLHSRFSLDLTGEASLWRFLPEDEDQCRYSAGLAASYRLKNGTLSAGYRYRASNSDLDTNDYRSNVVYVQAVLKF